MRVQTRQEDPPNLTARLRVIRCKKHGLYKGCNWALEQQNTDKVNLYILDREEKFPLHC